MNQKILNTDFKVLTNAELYDFLRDYAVENPLINVRFVDNEVSSDALDDIQRQELEYRAIDLDTYVDDASSPEWEETIVESQLSLDDYLINQLYSNYRQTPLRDLAERMIPRITDQGYFVEDLTEYADQVGYSSIEVLDALTLIQQLDPAGVGARNTKEFKSIYADRDPNAPDRAYYFIDLYHNDIVAGNFKEILENNNVDEAYLNELQTYLKTVPSDIEFDQSRDTFSSAGGRVLPSIEIRNEYGNLVIDVAPIGKPVVTLDRKYIEALPEELDEDSKAFIAENRETTELLIDKLNERDRVLKLIGQGLVQQWASYLSDEVSSPSPLRARIWLQQMDISEDTFITIFDQQVFATPRGYFSGQELRVLRN